MPAPPAFALKKKNKEFADSNFHALENELLVSSLTYIPFVGKKREWKEPRGG
jgi:hypothetical protein